MDSETTKRVASVRHSVRTSGIKLDHMNQAEGDQLCCGWIYKKNMSKRWGNWKKRYAVLEGRCLTYFTHEKYYKEYKQKHYSNRHLRGRVEVVEWKEWGGADFGFEFITT